MRFAGSSRIGIHIDCAEKGRMQNEELPSLAGSHDAATENLPSSSTLLPDAEERKKLEDYAESLRALGDSRMRERSLNTAIEYPEESFYSTLDSKLKSTTGYIKKLKILTESQRDALEKDFQSMPQWVWLIWDSSVKTLICWDFGL